MNVVVLGGAGYFGRAVSHFLAKTEPVTEVIVAGRNGDAARSFAKRLGPKGRGTEIEIDDALALDRVLAGADMVVNATGPYFVTLIRVLEAAIRCRTDYVDFAEDLATIEEALALDELARTAGVTAIVGMGSAPGITNLMVLDAIHRLDRIDRIQVGWAANVEGLTGPLDERIRGIRAGYPVSASLQSVTRYASGRIKAYRDGQWIEIPAFGASETVSLADGSELTAYPVGTAEPMMMMPHLPDVRTVSGLIALLPPQGNELMRRHAAPISSGERSAAEAVTGFLEELASDRARWLEGPPSMTAGGKFAVVHGIKDGRPARYACAPRWRCRTDDPGIKRSDTGAAAALASLKLLRGDVAQKGVMTPEACFEPTAFFRELAGRWAGFQETEPLLQERFDWLGE